MFNKNNMRNYSNKSAKILLTLGRHTIVRHELLHLQCDVLKRAQID